MDVHDISDVANVRLVSTGPSVDPSQCVGAIASNGLLFYTAHGSGLQMAKVWGAEAVSPGAPWEAP